MDEDQINENISPEPTLKPTRKGGIIKILLITVAVLALAAAGVAYYFYDAIYGKKLNPLSQDLLLDIPSKTDLNGIVNLLAEKQLLKDKTAFLWVANLMKYKGKTGRYRIPKTVQSYHSLIRVLRSKQEPVKLTFNNFRLKDQLAGHVSRYIEADSLSLLAAMTSTETLDGYGFNAENAMAMYIPDTYNMNWDTDAKSFVARMYKEYNAFWDKNNRREKAKKLEMTPIEVYILASIVDAETTYNPEKPRVAGVYLNRLKTEGWKLEADPTVVFAGGDFSVRRVTNDLLAINSPYNTYQHAGLPPGPIRMASSTAIDAVLDAEKHDYWFFCAKPPTEGQPAQHAFATTGAQHGANARAYRQWLNSQKIYK